MEDSNFFLKPLRTVATYMYHGNNYTIVRKQVGA